MNDYLNYITTSAEPEPSSMIETFRAIGYNIQTAAADIIDNSISAGAKNVWVDFEWRGAQTWLAFKDDGTGMNNDELIQAMRPGSRNPTEIRGTKDLGRFGLGLKTASFSQCRQLSVISKTENSSPVYWTWDLDYVNQTRRWDLIQYLPEGFLNSIDNVSSGTTIIWKNLDRLVKDFQEDSTADLNKFLLIMEQAKKHLAMIFHRFMESHRVTIFFQQRPIESWNPFLTNDNATQSFPDEPLQNSKVRIRGFVLPHKSKLTEDEFRKNEGPNGWNDQQGFYIYRNERLLVAGDWLGMFRKEEHYKLARIQVDLPNNLDDEWQIDIKKSVARPPLALRDQLKAYASRIRAQAVEVYRHKGKILQRKYGGIQFQPVWHEKMRHGKRFYEINRDHPVIQTLIASLTGAGNEISQLLKFVEETVPVSLITIKESENPEMLGHSFEATDQEPIRKAMKLIHNKLMNEGRNVDQAKAIILNIEPFNHFPQFLESLNH